VPQKMAAFFRSAGLSLSALSGRVTAFLNLRFAADLAFLFVQSERQNGRREAGATKERRDVRGESMIEVRC
jgi:hypothetical protein